MIFTPTKVYVFLLSGCEFGGEGREWEGANCWIVALSLDFVVAIVTFCATHMSNSSTHGLLLSWSLWVLFYFLQSLHTGTTKRVSFHVLASSLAINCFSFFSSNAMMWAESIFQFYCISFSHKHVVYTWGIEISQHSWPSSFMPKCFQLVRIFGMSSFLFHSQRQWNNSFSLCKTPGMYGSPSPPSVTDAFTFIFPLAAPSLFWVLLGEAKESPTLHPAADSFCLT